MGRFRWLLVVAVAFGLLTVAGCGSSGGGSDEAAPTTSANSDDGGGDDGGGGAAAGDFVTGTQEEWLAVVCGDDAEISTSDSDLEPRYGADATSSAYCTPPAQADGSDTYPEAVLFSADPTAEWEAPVDEGSFKTWAIGQVSDDEWAVVYEDSSAQEIAEPHLAGLTEFGFTVYENNELVS